MIKSSVYLSVAVLVTMLFSMTGCVTAPFVPPSGMVFTQFTAPLDVDFENTDMSGVKKGTADTISILGLFAFGDASSQAAAQNGGITKIVHADYEYLNILFGIYQKTTVIVYGK
ncbi:MAG: TRL-like family protein [Kiritimatiellales bacterium]